MKSNTKKLFAAFFLGAFLFFPAISLAAVCCVCDDGSAKTIPLNDKGNQIYDLYECGKHGAWGKPCSISQSADCISDPAFANSEKYFCCVCSSEGGIQTVVRDVSGRPIRDMYECGAHGAMNKPCKVSKSNDCAVIGDQTPIMEELDKKFELQDVSSALGISIPGLRFSAPASQMDEEGNIYLPWIGEYIKAIYNFSVVAISILAVVVLVMSGAQIIMSGGGQAKAAAYKRIIQVIIGLFIAWGSYAILYTINPALTKFRPLKVKYIEEYLYEFEGNYIEYSPTVMPPPKGSPELEKKAYDIAAKLGINGCFFAAQIGMESRWDVAAATKCCKGLGQIAIDTAKGLLKNKRAQIVNLHSQGCPNCPSDSASDGVIASWLTSDAEGNLILAALIRKNDLRKTGNAVAVIAAYGMGVGSLKTFISRTGCSMVGITEEELLATVNSVSADDFIKRSCIPPDIWPLANQTKHFDCPPDSSSPITYCCRTGTEDGEAKNCKQPEYSVIGRHGLCMGGTRDGQSCFAVAGGETYVRTFLNAAKKCASY